MKMQRKQETNKTLHITVRSAICITFNQGPLGDTKPTFSSSEEAKDSVATEKENQIYTELDTTRNAFSQAVSDPPQDSIGTNARHFKSNINFVPLLQVQ